MSFFFGGVYHDKQFLEILLVEPVCDRWEKLLHQVEEHDPRGADEVIHLVAFLEPAAARVVRGQLKGQNEGEGEEGGGVQEQLWKGAEEEAWSSRQVGGVGRGEDRLSLLHVHGARLPGGLQSDHAAVAAFNRIVYLLAELWHLQRQFDGRREGGGGREGGGRRGERAKEFPAIATSGSDR